MGLEKLKETTIKFKEAPVKFKEATKFKGPHKVERTSSHKLERGSRNFERPSKLTTAHKVEGGPRKVERGHRCCERGPQIVEKEHGNVEAGSVKESEDLFKLKRCLIKYKGAPR